MYNSRVFTGNRISDYFCITFLYSLTPPIKRVPYSPPLLYQNVHCIITVVLKTSLLSLTPPPPFHRWEEGWMEGLMKALSELHLYVHKSTYFNWINWRIGPQLEVTALFFSWSHLAALNYSWHKCAKMGVKQL